MTDSLLWRRLTETDFRAINGDAAPSGSGGGAMHIALGTDKDNFPIVSFLGNAHGTHSVTINIQPNPPHIPSSKLTFDGNPKRRGGEWRITDQFNHRNPTWTREAGFPQQYNKTNRPVIFVIKQGNEYHTRLSSEKVLRSALPSLAEKIDKSVKKSAGILKLDPTWLSELGIQPRVDMVESYKGIADSAVAEKISAFDPKDISDGRQKTLREIVRRQGQQSFRKGLLKAYKRCCAISGCNIEAVLEAAHISPYRGPKTNHPSNGILLRADLHTLFDLGLITIDAAKLLVRVSEQLEGSEYKKYENGKIRVPDEEDKKPSKEALSEHNESFK